MKERQNVKDAFANLCSVLRDRNSILHFALVHDTTCFPITFLQ